MNRRRFLLPLVSLLVLGLVVVAPACKKRTAEVVPEPTPAPAVPAPMPTPAPPVEVEEPFREEQPPPPVDLSAEQVNAQGVLKTVYFDYDKFDLGESTRATLRANADWLRANPKWKVAIEGHCDERGTTEYNLELGAKRGRAVRDFLTSLGVAAERMRTVSYGEERPADPGHGESAWSKNRRAEFKVE